MSLVIFTCVVGLLIAPIQVDFFTAMFSLIAVALGAGAAGTLNMWYESDIDALMQRTCLRPIPSGKISRNQALIFGVQKNIIKKRKIGSNVMLFVAIVQPIIGGKAPAAPPITIF